MKHFENMRAFERRIEKGPNWDDYFLLNRRMWTIYEYGPGIGVELGYHYIYFLNKRSGDMIHVRYDCPSYQYVNGERVQTKKYRLIEVEYLEDYPQWR